MLIQFGNDHVYNPIVSDSGFRFFYFSQSIASNFIGSNHPSVYDLPCSGRLRRVYIEFVNSAHIKGNQNIAFRGF